MNDVERIVMLPPYVEPAHKKLIDEAKQVLIDYSESLTLRLKQQYRINDSSSIAPRIEDIERAERDFINDPTRMALIKHLSFMKLCYERPRFKVNAT